jgi:hypothetical protein
MLTEFQGNAFPYLLSQYPGDLGAPPLIQLDTVSTVVYAMPTKPTMQSRTSMARARELVATAR